MYPPFALRLCLNALVDEDQTNVLPIPACLARRFSGRQRDKALPSSNVHPAGCALLSCSEPSFISTESI